MKFKIVIIASILLLNLLDLYVHIPYLANALTIILSLILLFRVCKKGKEKRDKESTVKEVILQNKDSSSSNLIDENPTMCSSCIENIYYIKNSIPIIKKITANTLEYEEEALNEIFILFDNLWDESEKLIEKSGSCINNLFEHNKKDNLYHILELSKEVDIDFNNFIPALHLMSVSTNNFIDKSINNFSKITKTTKNIVELSEQIKVISINVRIEAARLQNSGGFKVLGNDISKFADKTSNVADITNEIIVETVKEITELKQELYIHIKKVEDMANSIQKKVSPFQSIVESSSITIKNTITELHSSINKLKENLKGSITKLQFQDITSQESSHVLDFINDIETNELFLKNVDNYLDKDKKNMIKNKIIDFMNNVSTTDNERNEIALWSKKWNISINKENEVSGRKIDKGIILWD